MLTHRLTRLPTPVVIGILAACVAVLAGCIARRFQYSFLIFAVLGVVGPAFLMTCDLIAIVRKLPEAPASTPEQKRQGKTIVLVIGLSGLLLAAAITVLLLVL